MPRIPSKAFIAGQRLMSYLSRIWQCCISDGVPRRALCVALVVGTVLNLINQGDALFGEGRLNWIKLVLTFVVPYCVATYGAMSYRLRTPAPNSESPTEGMHEAEWSSKGEDAIPASEQSPKRFQP